MMRNASSVKLCCGKSLLVAFDIVSVAIVSFIACMAFVRPAWAYVDPSVMTYTIQALAGVAVALSAVAGVALRRTRRMIMRSLNIDENAGKIVEADIHRVDPKTGEIIDNGFAEADRSNEPSKNKTAQGKLSWKKRFAFSLIACLALALTVFFVAPVELVASNVADLVIGVNQILPIMAVFSVSLAIVLALALSAFRGRAFNIAFALAVSLAVCAWVEAMFLNSKLPIADGGAVIWGNYDTITAISGLAWVMIIAAIVLVCVKKERFGRFLSSACAIALILIQFVGIGSLLLGADANDDSAEESMSKTTYVTTKEGLFQVSEKNNVIVFVLDFFDTKLLQDDFAADPSMLDEMTGFTWFQNSTGSMIPTRYGVPYLLTGSMPSEDRDLRDFLANRYKSSTFLNDIHDAGYSIGVYTDSIGNGYSELSDVSVNVCVDDPSKNEVVRIAKLQTIAELSKCALYRDAPWIAKRFFWFYTDEINNAVTAVDEESEMASPYLMNDMLLNEELCKKGLKADDNARSGSLRLIHMVGAHYPFVMNAQRKVAQNEDEANMGEQSRGSMAIVSEYLRQLKDMGLYEDATIIITADHGFWYCTEEPLNEPCSPIMLVKKSGESQGACKISNAQTGHVDYPATVMAAVGKDSSKYGLSVWDAPDSGRIRYYDMTTSDGKEDQALLQYEISDDVMDINNWRLNGVSWGIPDNYRDYLYQ